MEIEPYEHGKTEEATGDKDDATEPREVPEHSLHTSKGSGEREEIGNVSCQQAWVCFTSAGTLDLNYGKRKQRYSDDKAVQGEAKWCIEFVVTDELNDGNDTYPEDTTGNHDTFGNDVTCDWNRFSHDGNLLFQWSQRLR